MVSSYLRDSSGSCGTSFCASQHAATYAASFVPIGGSATSATSSAAAGILRSSVERYRILYHAATSLRTRRPLCRFGRIECFGAFQLNWLDEPRFAEYRNDTRHVGNVFYRSASVYPYRDDLRTNDSFQYFQWIAELGRHALGSDPEVDCWFTGCSIADSGFGGCGFGPPGHYIAE